uniref:Uncharacterized protein n=1 Tax=Rhizophagus irregularis (strain DAOM 181602 / DAOM 197198 / MUCL 43194) TaxID=747089 RepID=U9UJZ1_RHIID
MFITISKCSEIDSSTLTPKFLKSSFQNIRIIQSMFREIYLADLFKSLKRRTSVVNKRLNTENEEYKKLIQKQRRA